MAESYRDMVGRVERLHRMPFADAVEAILHRQRRIWKFRDDAVADGWLEVPTYATAVGRTFSGVVPGEMIARVDEPVDMAFNLHRDGFMVSGICRPSCWPDKPMPEASMTGWGPDGAQIRLPDKYDWQAIVAELTHCPECGKRDVKTVRVAFANRACDGCAQTLTTKLCKQGWAD